MSLNQCIFCGHSPTTKEDVWPTWLGNYITRDMPAYNLGEIIFDFPNSITKIVDKVTKRNGDPRVMRVKCACQACNSGWMSRLQNLTKPLLLQLMQGEKIDLEPLQQRTLASWIAMSVTCAEFRFPEKVTIPFNDRWTLKHVGNPADNWKIWIGDFNRKHWKPWHVHHNLLVTEGDETVKIVDGKAAPIEVIYGHSRFFNTQITTIVFERLYILAYSSEINDLISGVSFIMGGVPLLTPIWPRRTETISWPPKFTMDDANADTVTGYIHSRLTGIKLAIASMSVFIYFLGHSTSSI